MSLHALGVNAIHLAKPQEAAQHLMESLALREQIGDLRGVANLRTVLGNWLAYRGELEEAQQHFRESITGFHEVGDEGAVVQALTFIGGIARSRGELGEAKSTLLAALERQRALGPEKRMVAILRELGRVSLDAGETAQARGYYEECRLLLRRFDDADGLAALEDDLARLQQQEAAGE
jgi:tetratricopeptide (TPR) repeat protein